MQRPSRRMVCFLVGCLLVLAGLQLRVVDTYVLSPGATRVAARWFGAEPGTVRGTVEWIALETGNPRKALTPPEWLGWALVSSGLVSLAYAVISGRRR